MEFKYSTPYSVLTDDEVSEEFLQGYNYKLGFVYKELRSKLYIIPKIQDLEQNIIQSKVSRLLLSNKPLSVLSAPTRKVRIIVPTCKKPIKPAFAPVECTEPIVYNVPISASHRVIKAYKKGKTTIRKPLAVLR